VYWWPQNGDGAKVALAPNTMIYGCGRTNIELWSGSKEKIYRARQRATKNIFMEVKNFKRTL